MLEAPDATWRSYRITTNIFTCLCLRRPQTPSEASASSCTTHLSLSSKEISEKLLPQRWAHGTTTSSQSRPSIASPENCFCRVRYLWRHSWYSVKVLVKRALFSYQTMDFRSLHMQWRCAVLVTEVSCSVDGHTPSVRYQRDPKRSCRLLEFSKDLGPRESPDAVTGWSPSQSC